MQDCGPATDTSTRKLSNRTKRAEHGNPSPQPKQITIMAINTTSLRRHWPNLAREKDITHWACTEVRILKEDQLWFSERYTKEDKINVTWGPPMDRREDGQPEFGGTCVRSKQPAFSIPFESFDWLRTTKRFLMVKIPIGNGSKNATLMVVHAHPGRGKEANAQNEHIFDAVVGLADGLGETPLMICGDLQHEPRRQSRHLDFAISQGWLTDLGQTHKPAGAAQPLHTDDTDLGQTHKPAGVAQLLDTDEQGDPKTRLDFALVNEAFRAAVGDFEVVQRNLVPKHKGLKITLTVDTYEQKVWMMRQPTTLNAEDQQLLELTFRRKWKQVNHEYEQAIMDARNSNQRRRKSEAMSKAWRVITDAFAQSMLIQTAQKPKYMRHKVKTPKFLQDHSRRLHQTRKDWRSGSSGETAPKLGKQDCWIQR